MAITFHCQHCDRKIEAADDTGGKWGKCPACHNRVYIPDLTVEDDGLKLAPVDEQEEARKKELMAETYQVSQDILQEREVPAGPDESPTERRAGMSEKELTINIINYLRQMADGNLESAEKIAGAITPNRNKALEIVDRIALSDMPEPELADVPQHVLAGFIRILRGKIG